MTMKGSIKRFRVDEAEITADSTKRKENAILKFLPTQIRQDKNKLLILSCSLGWKKH